MKSLSAAMVGRMSRVMDEKRIGQAELARRLDTPGATISAWRHGKSVPSAELLLRLPGALNVSPMWLFYGDGLDGFRTGIEMAAEKVRQLERELEELIR